MNFLSKTILATACIAFTNLYGGTVLLNPTENMTEWRVFNGPEFPGASGKILTDPDNGKVTLHANFTQKSQYVTAVYRPELPKGIEMFHFLVVPSHRIEVSYRLVDANGRSFQSRRTWLEPGKETRLLKPYPFRGIATAGFGNAKGVTNVC